MGEVADVNLGQVSVCANEENDLGDREIVVCSSYSLLTKSQAGQSAELLWRREVSQSGGSSKRIHSRPLPLFFLPPHHLIMFLLSLPLAESPVITFDGPEADSTLRGICELLQRKSPHTSPGVSASMPHPANTSFIPPSRCFPAWRARGGEVRGPRVALRRALAVLPSRARTGLQNTTKRCTRPKRLCFLGPKRRCAPAFSSKSVLHETHLPLLLPLTAAQVGPTGATISLIEFLLLEATGIASQPGAASRLDRRRRQSTARTSWLGHVDAYSPRPPESFSPNLETFPNNRTSGCSKSQSSATAPTAAALWA